jgi:antitoxin (DNA-binding transcriptional repressor) of toxin-antitoxin stability system
MQTYSVQEIRNHLPRLLQDVASGCELIIMEDGKPMARILKIEKRKPMLRFGVLKGKARVSDDFDKPLPDDVLSGFEGD